MTPAQMLKWIAGGLAVIVMALGAWAGDTLIHKAENAEDSVRKFQIRLNKQEVETAKQTLQLSAIAKAVQAPVVVDTVYADSVVMADTTQKDST